MDGGETPPLYSFGYHIFFLVSRRPGVLCIIIVSGFSCRYYDIRQFIRRRFSRLGADSAVRLVDENVGALSALSLAAVSAFLTHGRTIDWSSQKKLVAIFLIYLLLCVPGIY